MSETSTFSADKSCTGGWHLDHSYSRLPETFHTSAAPTPVKEPRLVVLNRPLADALGLDADLLGRPDKAGLFVGNLLPPGAEPRAQAYAGHQFGNFTPLGDGRAILLGEQLTPDGRRLDIQLKGAGPTRYSRRGDGRAALGPMLREYILSEAMQALGIPTTRSLAVATTGEPVYREQILAGAVLTRVAASHIRVGTFEWASALQDRAALLALTDYTMQRHYPELVGTADSYRAFFQAVAERQASLIARWQLVGFIHGVMNTDNMAISGETIDYGPCAFMDTYDPATVFSSIDRQGRYAYRNQPLIAQWNLARLAETLLPLFHDEREAAVEWANQAIESFPARFQSHWLAGMRLKLGLVTEEDSDAALTQELLAWMHRERRDFTNTFRDLATDIATEEARRQHPDFEVWYQRWQARLSRQSVPVSQSLQAMKRHNPAVIPRNHRVEEALAAANSFGDLNVMHRLLEALSKPFDQPTSRPEFTDPPPPGERVYQTFCGT